MKAITCKYVPATNTRTSRIKAFDCDKNSVTIPYDYGMTEYELYKKAAVALCNKMLWMYSDTLVGGGIRDGYVFVFNK